jgi:serine/threonine protein kinase
MKAGNERKHPNGFEKSCGSGALERSESERTRFVEQACAGDDALRQEVESLLGYRSEAQELMDKPAAEMLAQSLANHVLQLEIGRQIGSYKILSLIGGGGMGQVYKAADTRLDREVAIKVLSGTLARDREWLARFEREAKMLAALNHPNIAHIYGVEDSALIMELVGGSEPRGPLPWKDVWKIGSQIVDALEYAHDQRIIHRDLKPANIRVTPEGKVKLLDFGLAKPIHDGPADPNGPENSPAISAIATRAGIILGTAAYMAPEQARGKDADRRCDIWAFGAILFELLSGKRAFPGNSVSDTLAMVLTTDPDWNALPTATPPPARKLIKYCLEKDPSRRLQAIGDARLLLEGEPEPAQPPAPWKLRFLWGLIAVLFVIASWGWLRPQKQSPVPPKFELTILPPKGGRFPNTSAQVGAPLLSPDGSSILIGSIFRKLDELEIRPLPKMSGLSGEAFWSPDSKWVAFPAAGFQKMSVPDGAPEPITAGQTPLPCRGGTWGRDGVILVACFNLGRRALYLLSAGGAITQLNVPGLEPGGAYFHPEFLPESSDFLFVFHARNSSDGGVFMATLRENRVINPVRLMRNDTAAHYTPAGGGCLLFVRGDNLYMQRLNLNERRLEGEPLLLQQGVASDPPDGLADFSVSRTGLVAWRPGTAGQSQMTVFDRQGNPVGTFGPPGNFSQARLSPDEGHLVVGSELLDRDQPGELDLGSVVWSVWSADGLNLFGYQDSWSGQPLEDRRVRWPKPRILFHWRIFLQMAKLRFIAQGTLSPTGFFSLSVWIPRLREDQRGSSRLASMSQMHAFLPMGDGLSIKRTLRTIRLWDSSSNPFPVPGCEGRYPPTVISRYG